MKTIFTSLIVIAAMFALSGCCTKNACAYNNRSVHKADCASNPNNSERQECYNEHSQPYNPNQYKTFN